MITQKHDENWEFERTNMKFNFKIKIFKLILKQKYAWSLLNFKRHIFKFNNNNIYLKTFKKRTTYEEFDKSRYIMSVLLQTSKTIKIILKHILQINEGSKRKQFKWENHRAQL